MEKRSPGFYDVLLLASSRREMNEEEAGLSSTLLEGFILEKIRKYEL